MPIFCAAGSKRIAISNEPASWQLPVSIAAVNPQRMIDAMVLRGMARRTQEAYLSAVAQLARHYHCSPDRLDAVEVQAWLLHRISERKLAYPRPRCQASR